LGFRGQPHLGLLYRIDVWHNDSYYERTIEDLNNFDGYFGYFIGNDLIRYYEYIFHGLSCVTDIEFDWSGQALKYFEEEYQLILHWPINDICAQSQEKIISCIIGYCSRLFPNELYTLIYNGIAGNEKSKRIKKKSIEHTPDFTPDSDGCDSFTDDIIQN